MEVNLTLAFKKIKPNSSKIEKAISRWTDSKYYHVELIIDNIWVSSNDVDGITKRKLEKLDHDKWDYVSIPIILGKKVNIHEDTYEVIWRWIDSKIGTTYDYYGLIFSQILPLNMHDRDKYFCSEIDTNILKLFAIEPFLNHDANYLSPGDMARITKLEKREYGIKPPYLKRIRNLIGGK